MEKENVAARGALILVEHGWAVVCGPTETDICEKSLVSDSSVCAWLGIKYLCNHQTCE